jgi:hypothetical protein
MCISEDLIDQIRDWVSQYDHFADGGWGTWDVKKFAENGSWLATRLANQLQEPVEYFDEHKGEFETVQPTPTIVEIETKSKNKLEVDFDSVKGSTVKTDIMWKSGRKANVLAGEVTTIIGEEKFYLHASDWWSGEGFDVTIEGPKGLKHHISLPCEAWAVLASMIEDMTGGTSNWLSGDEKE